MADTQLMMTSLPKSSVEDCKKRLMSIFEDITKDCEDKGSRNCFDSIRDYDALNAKAIEMFCTMADSGFLDEARELFKPLPDQVTLPEVAVYTMVISTYAENGNINDAHKVYQQMIASGVTPTTYTYTALISGFARDFSNLELVGYGKKFFLEMLDRGMKPHYQQYIDLMSAIAYQGPLEKAKTFLQQIQAKGFNLDQYGFPYKDGDLSERMQLLRISNDIIHSIDDADVHKFVLKLCSSPRIYRETSMNMFIAVLKDGDVNEAMEFYNSIKHTATETLFMIHTLVIEAYLKFGKTKSALEAYLAMLAAGFAPNSYTYTVLIKGLAADPNFFEDAKMYLLEMMDKGKQPNAATYSAVIEGFVLWEEKTAEEKGKEFVEVMMSKGFVPNAKAVREVLKGKPTPVIRRVMNIVLSKLIG